MTIAENVRMLSGIFSTSSGKTAIENDLQIISNNLANALTAGFKAVAPVFSSMNVEEATSPDQLPATYVAVPDCYIQFYDAPLTQTGNAFDLAIEGNGFFAISTPQGKMYTRNGRFAVNADKKLVTQSGYPVISQGGGDITIDGKDVTITSDGSVYVDRLFVDRLTIVDFPNKQALTNTGGSLFANASRKDDEVPAEGFFVQQGAYEGSNVDIMKEMVQMITVLRAYESYTRLDQSASDMLGKLIDLGKF
jgi:flagellar basal-body rod protein FlgG